MSREDLIALLFRLMDDGAIDEAQAEHLLEIFDAGEPTGLEPPLAPEEVERGIDERIVLAALLFLALQMGHRRAEMAAQAPGLARQLGRAGQIALAERLQSAFEQEARELARRLVAGEIPLAQWQRGMGDAVRRHLIAQSAAGRGVLGEAELIRSQGLSVEEMAYLSRFADGIALARLQGNPWSLAQIQRRAASYGGTARGEFWRGIEQAAIEDDPDDLAGWVVDYISRDDPATCSPCLDADLDSPYLPGQGPYPGQVCLGGDNCRCIRELRWDPDAYADMAGAFVG